MCNKINLSRIASEHSVKRFSLVEFRTVREEV